VLERQESSKHNWRNVCQHHTLRYYSAQFAQSCSTFSQVLTFSRQLRLQTVYSNPNRAYGPVSYNMCMAKLSIKDLDLKDKTVFMRVDFNVPLAGGGQEITSDKRIRASLPTIQYALEHCAGVVLASHLGRPKGKRHGEMSLAPVAVRLSELLGRPVTMAPDCVGPETAALKPKPGEVLLLENLRFHSAEEANDPEFSKQLASLADIYVNDAFGSAHRAHASTVGIVSHLPIAATGLLMDKELEWLTKASKSPEHPCVALIGGAKVSDKIEVIQNLLKVVDKLLIGGAMAYTFLRAKDETTGKSLVEEDKIELARQLLDANSDKLVLPVDHVVVREIKPGAANEVVTTIAADRIAVDIGPQTIEEYAKIIGGAKTVIWNGPMGIFEMPPFDKGTVALAKAVAESGAVSVVGGGDSEKAIKSAGVSDKITHVSTGGGASLEFLGGSELPGVVALTEKTGASA
jgi:phosphoglycerate kinase